MKAPRVTYVLFFHFNYLRDNKVSTLVKCEYLRHELIRAKLDYDFNEMFFAFSLIDFYDDELLAILKLKFQDLNIVKAEDFKITEIIT